MVYIWPGRIRYLVIYTRKWYIWPEHILYLVIYTRKWYIWLEHIISPLLFSLCVWVCEGRVRKNVPLWRRVFARNVRPRIWPCISACSTPCISACSTTTFFKFRFVFQHCLRSTQRHDVIDIFTSEDMENMSLVIF